MMHTSRVTELSLLWDTRLGETNLCLYLHEVLGSERRLRFPGRPVEFQTLPQTDA